MSRKLLAGFAILVVGGKTIIGGMTNTAWSASVFYDFSIEVESGALSGQTLTGSFSIDDSLLAGPNLLDFGGLGVLESFEFSFGGFDFDTSNADLTLLAFSGGELDRFLAGGAPSGFNTLSTLDDQADFSIISDDECPNCPFRYDLDTRPTFGEGSFTFARRVEIPEPGSLVLLAAGIVAVAMGRRQRNKSDRSNSNT